MMPIAMGILWLELQLLHKITVPIDSEEEYASFGHCSWLGVMSLGLMVCKSIAMMTKLNGLSL